MGKKISLEEMKKIAHLSKLQFEEKELLQFFRDVNEVVEHFEKLDRLDLQDVSPTSHISWSQPPMNFDNPTEWGKEESVFQCAPLVVNRYFVVPKVVDKEER
ncbi:MAG: Asp-tRNA(Asn)/Glu-tRNA(Gln) amidotransferase subunit GatC [Candidatus Caldatribacteriaceae bacterium]